MESVWFPICSALVVSVLASEPARSQIRERVESENIELAYELANNLIASRQEFPARWAAAQKRRLVNTYDLANLRITETNVLEVSAERTSENPKNRVYYGRFTTGGKAKNIDSSRAFLGFEVCSYEGPTKKLHKPGAKPWEVVDKIPNIGYSTSDPFSWCVGFLNTARMGKLDSSMLRKMFYGVGRECWVAKYNKDGLLVTFWVTKKKSPPGFPAYHFEARFDVDRGVITYYGLNAHESTEVSIEEIRQGRFKPVEFGEVSWDTFKAQDRQGKTQTWQLPVEIKSFSVLNEDEEIECTNSIRWLLGAEVPDSVFLDPRDEGFQEPEFSFDDEANHASRVDGN
ncbi:MAG: hypothetical protein AB8B50_15280 [Pirellulaceae bacterium]